MTLQTSWLRTHNVWIRGMLEKGYSRTKIYDVSRKQGWGIRKTDALETLRYYMGVKETARDAWKSTPLKYKPADIRIPRFPGITSKRYLAEIVITRRDVETGKEEKKAFRLGFDDMMNRSALEDKVREIGKKAGVDYDKPAPEITRIDKIEIFKSKFV